MTTESRGLDVEVNTIPLIDIMSLLVVFLLLTTVWTQMAQLSIAKDEHGAGAAAAAPPALAVLVTRESVWLGAAGGNVIELPVEDRDGLRDALRTAEPHDRVRVAAEPGVSYERIVTVMDAALGAGYQRVGFVDEDLLGVRFRR
jgi:biopolymer transport protein ExbD